MSKIQNIELDGKNFGVFFASAGKKIISAERIQRAVAVFNSRPFELSSKLISWNKLSWDGVYPYGTATCFYVRSANSQNDIELAKWSGPFLNGNNEDISTEKGKFIQFKIALYSYYNSETIFTPAISMANISCYIQGNSEKFYTSKLDLGFIPKHIVLTYNGTIPTDTIIQFAVTTSGENDLSYYKVIEPNTITSIEDIASAEFLKVAITALGNTKIPFVIDEFGLAIGGEGRKIIS